MKFDYFKLKMENIIKKILNVLKNEKENIMFIGEQKHFLDSLSKKYFNCIEHNVEETLNKLIQENYRNRTNIFINLLNVSKSNNIKIFYTYHLKEDLTYLDLPVEFLFEEFVFDMVYNYDDGFIDPLYDSFIEAFELKKENIKLHKIIMELILINNEYKRQIKL